MNAIDGIFNFVSGFMEKVAKWIPKVDIPWDRLPEKWRVIQPYLDKANVILPIDSILTVLGIVVVFFGVMLVLWGIKFLKSFIPFLG